MELYFGKRLVKFDDKDLDLYLKWIWGGEHKVIQLREVDRYRNLKDPLDNIGEIISVEILYDTDDDWYEM